MSAAREVRESTRVAAPAEDVWRAFADPAWLTGWLAERAGGAAVTGGTLELAWDSLGMAVALEVLAAEPPARLVLRAQAPGRAPQTQTVAIAREPDGATRIDLTHDGFAPGARGDDERDGTGAGWHVQLRVLAHYLAHHRGAARACAASLAPVTAPLDTVAPLLHTPDGLARWLTASPARLGAEGARCDFALRGGTWLSGTVLAVAAPRELALAIDEFDGGLRLRAIQLDPGALLCVAQVWSWAPDSSVWPTVRQELDEAVARLAAAAGSVQYNA
jgi:uncharacterized protein YndB with AHSA1/START domain